VRLTCREHFFITQFLAQWGDSSTGKRSRRRPAKKNADR